MISIYRKRLLVCGPLFLILLLAACGPSSNLVENTPAQTATQQTYHGRGTPCGCPANGMATPCGCPANGTSTPVPADGTPGIGPIVILSPTPVPGGNAHSQLVTLPDRILVISDISKVAGVDSDSTGISMTMTMKNTGTKPITNQASYFQLVGAEGDTFGLQSSATASFFGTIVSRASRSGTIIFQVPAAAVNGLRLLFRSAAAAETVTIPLAI